VNFHVYHYAANNPVKYVDPDGRFFGIDDAIGAAIQCFRDGEWNKYGERFKSNFTNSWKFIAFKLFLPMSWIELARSPLTSLVNTVVGYGAIQGFGGEVSTDGLTTNIQVEGRWGAVSLGSVIIGDDNLFTRYLSHEQGHFFQSLLLGWLYWPVIGLSSLISASRDGKNGHNHEDFWTEKWADAWQPKNK
jgi:hypothetical protein